MKDFSFYMPVKVISGKNCVVENAKEYSAFGKKALIVTGKHSAKASGALNDIIAGLESNGQGYALFDKSVPNPTIASVYEGADFAIKEGADFVIAIGGGSPMDTAKAIAVLAVNRLEESALFSGEYSAALPMVFIPTTAGTGSEVTQYSVLTNDKIESKTSMASSVLFPKLALLDAQYTLSLSYNTTLNTAIDALSHSVEGMLSKRANAVSDALAEKSISMIRECMDALKANTLTFLHREKLLVASTLAGMVIAQTGTTAVHSLGYSLTYFKGADHGLANGYLLGAFLGFIEKHNPELAKSVLKPFGMASAQEFKSDMAELLGNMPALTADEIELYAEKAAKTRNVNNCAAPVAYSNLVEVLQAALKL
ncbi:MAG: iron-containing alcohol dehydrogenase family protein [Clostridia bacterium]